MPFLDFGYTDPESLDIVDAAIAYAIRATNNRLYETGIHSPFRFLTETQAFVYNRFLYDLQSLDGEFERLLFNLMGFDAAPSLTSQRMLRFELTDPNRIASGVVIEAGFPVKSSGGVIFKTDRAISIPPGSAVGFISATSTQVGAVANLQPGTVLIPLKPVIGVDGLIVTIDHGIREGRSGESFAELKQRLAEHLRHQCLSTEDDFRWWISQRYPNAATNIFSTAPGTVTITTTGTDGKPLSALELDRIKTELQNKVKLGIRINVEPMRLIPVDVTVIAARNLADSNYETLAMQFESIARDYFRPVADWQQYGTVLITELMRMFGRSTADYIQTATIGPAGQVQHGNNFAFNPQTERIILSTLYIEITESRRTQQLQGFSSQVLFSKTVTL